MWQLVLICDNLLWDATGKCCQRFKHVTWQTCSENFCQLLSTCDKFGTTCYNSWQLMTTCHNLKWLGSTGNILPWKQALARSATLGDSNWGRLGSILELNMCFNIVF